MTDRVSEQNFALQRQRMNETGIGLAGIEGAWWLPAAEPFRLPVQVRQELDRISRALFAFFDTVTAMAGREESLDELLNHKVPPHLPRLMGPGRVESVRPDFQLQLDAGGNYQPVLTELEICPSAQGFAHAMQYGYGLPTDLLESFAAYLQGRDFLFACSQQWSEFILEQLAFCRALAGLGVKARVLYDRPVSAMAADIRQGQRWEPPLFGVKEKPAGWNIDLLGRLHAHQFDSFLWPGDTAWPEEVGQAVVFRFGYFDCFSPAHLRAFLHWQARGATLLNPAMFILDSKVLLAALNLPVVRDRLAATQPEALAILGRCLPETRLLQAGLLPRLMAEKEDWVLKFAGFDSQNQAWGGRSLQFGPNHTQESWRQVLADYLALPWPVVAQRLVPSARIDIRYVDPQDRLQTMVQGYTRLRSFMLRESRPPGQVWVAGSHLTVSGGTMQVSEAVDAVQAPVVFVDPEKDGASFASGGSCFYSII